MIEFISETKTIPYSEEEVYSAFSDLQKLERVKDKIPQDDRILDISYGNDSCTVHVSPIGKIRLVVTEKIPNSMIKFEAQQLPFKLNLYILLQQENVTETFINTKVEADLNPFLKSFVSKPLQEALEKMADTLVIIPYNELND